MRTLNATEKQVLIEALLKMSADLDAAADRDQPAKPDLCAALADELMASKAVNIE